MPLPESTQAAALTFDAAVHRALSRRRADTPYPHNGGAAPPPPEADAPAAAPPAPAASTDADG